MFIPLSITVATLGSAAELYISRLGERSGAERLTPGQSQQQNRTAAIASHILQIGAAGYTVVTASPALAIPAVAGFGYMVVKPYAEALWKRCNGQWQAGSEKAEKALRIAKLINLTAVAILLTHVVSQVVPPVVASLITPAIVVPAIVAFAALHFAKDLQSTWPRQCLDVENFVRDHFYQWF
jgi:hypothetical protein